MIYTLSKVRDPSKTLTVILRDPIPQDSTWVIGKAILDDWSVAAVVARVRDDQVIVFCSTHADLPGLLQKLQVISSDNNRFKLSVVNQHIYYLYKIASVSPHKGIRPREVACRYVIEYSL